MAYFLMRSMHNSGMEALREKHRPQHREWVSSGGDGLVSVLIGSALTDSAGAAQGNFGIIEAHSETDARRFAEGDPYAKAAVVREIELTPLPDTFQAQRITEPMSPPLRRT
ncbi:YciI family protein [Pseudorhizobium pelagicum]|uniref:YCII-related domain-containing protein n=1 Tax=Pseudorhizobium pelagicum TaxID=1509405 RepID=A0A922TA24_9HYPH|nr:YciI family protein [Pseudorhizobium pelagicum]KEQ04234.1 hypothetical protein GV67_11200 [Pseudorhizobium pelagicum]KEQ04409.1 hypothetical protein GV68_13080 [Pseudorhizobium pelagicum]